MLGRTREITAQDRELIAFTIGASETDPNAYLLDGGFNSRVFRTGEQVVKLSHATFDLKGAMKQYDIMQGEYNSIYAYMSESMLPTEFKVIPGTPEVKSYKVASVQPFVEGSTVEEYIRRDDAELSPLLAFFSKALEMHNETHLIPDLCSMERRFNVLRSKNILIVGEGQTRLPDDNFGSTQRSPVTGRALSAGIAWGTRRGIRKLKKRLPKAA